VRVCVWGVGLRHALTLYSLFSSPSVALWYLSFFLLPFSFLQLLSSTIVFHHPGRSRFYFVFHQARIHSDAKQWKASTSAPLSPSLLSSLTPWCVSKSVLRRSRQIPKRRIVEKLYMFSPYIVFLSSSSSSSFSSLIHIFTIFFPSLSYMALCKKTNVSNLYQNETSFYSSTHLDFKCKCILRRKTQLKGWKEHTPRSGETSLRHVSRLRIQSTLWVVQGCGMFRVIAEFDSVLRAHRVRVYYSVE